LSFTEIKWFLVFFAISNENRRFCAKQRKSQHTSSIQKVRELLKNVCQTKNLSLAADLTTTVEMKSEMQSLFHVQEIDHTI